MGTVSIPFLDALRRMCGTVVHVPGTVWRVLGIVLRVSGVV